MCRRMATQFQSAPLTKARGDAPANAKRMAELPFQSAPLTKARGDLRRRRRPRFFISFNPLPSPKQGETQIYPHDQHPRPVSIRSPHQSKGRLDQRAGNAVGFGVSIRSPHQSKGRRSTMPLALAFRGVSIRSPHQSKGRQAPRDASFTGPWFQSAPLTKARGDRCKRIHVPSGMRFNPLPSPKQGETSATHRPTPA